MNRRDAISRVAILMGGTNFGAELFLSGCTSGNPAAAKFVLDANHISLLNEIGETILPQTTASGGSKAADVGQFMQVMIRDCYSPEEQKIFMEGNAQERQSIVLLLDNELKDFNDQTAHLTGLFFF